MTLFKRWKQDASFRKMVIIGIIIFIFLSNSAPPQTQSFVPKPTCDSKHFQGECETAGCYWASKGTFSNTPTLVKGAGVLYVTGEGCLIGAAAGAGVYSWITAPVGCTVGFIVGATGTNILSNVVSWFRSDCFSSLPDGYITDSMDKCTSGYANYFEAQSATGINLLDKTYYICATPTNPGDICKGWQKPFAGFFDGIWKKNGIDSCPTKAYMVIGVVGLLLVALI